MPGHKSPLRSQGKPPMMVRVRCHIFQKKTWKGDVRWKSPRCQIWSLEVSKSPPGGPETCPSESSPGMLEDSGFGQK